MYAETLSKLIDELQKLPGIGPKSAQRLAFFLVRSPDQVAAELGAAASELKKNLKFCKVCKAGM